MRALLPLLWVLSMAIPHERLLPVDEIGDPDDFVEVTPADFPNWAALFAAHPNRTDYLLNGDFRSWGTLTGLPGDGLPQRKRVIRFVDASAMPWERPGDEARILRFDISGEHYWILHGLSMDEITGPGAESYLQGDSTHIIVDGLWERNIDRPWGIRRRNVDFTSIQRSLIQDFVPTPGQDSTGIQDRLLSRSMTDNRVVSVQFRNCGDAIQATDSNTVPSARLENAIYADIDVEVTSDYYSQGGTKAASENAIDIKVAASGPGTAMQIEDLRCHGLRFTDPTFGGSGGDGAAIVVQLLAEYVTIRRPVIWDGPVGIKVEAWSPGPQQTRNVLVEDAVIHGMKVFAGVDFGAAIRAVTPETFVRCAFVHNVTLSSHAVLTGAHSITDSVVVDTPLGHAAAPWAAGVGNHEMSERLAGRLRVIHERLTGPETTYLDEGGALMTATTTLGLIRENQEAILAALTPLSITARPYVLHAGDEEFRDWAASNPSDCLRKFCITRLDSMPPPSSSDMVTRVRTAVLELVIAYPRLWNRYAGAASPDLGPAEDTIEQDQNQLDSRDGIGLDSYGSHVAGHHHTRITWSLERTPQVIFSVGRIDVTYYEEV